MHVYANIITSDLILICFEKWSIYNKDTITI